MDEDYQKRAARVKAMLSQYYGAEGATTDPSPAPSASGGRGLSARSAAHPAVPSIDTAAFNADNHIANILRSSTLEKLMVEHRNMAREIKNLDSDMQQLVYENYNKFIAATDTIRVMKTSIDQVTPEMEKLSSITDSVADKSLSVSAKLETRRETMEQLYRVQQLLKKLQAVFDLPKKMRAALEEDALDAAVSLYAEAQPLLHKYGGKGTFRMIAVESDFVAQEISQLLKRRLTERKDDAEQCVLLLRKLGEPDDTLQDKYLAGRAARVRRVLSEAGVVADAMSLAASGTPVSLPSRTVVEAAESWGFTQQGPPALKTFIKALDEKFINALQETVINVTRFFLQDATGAAAQGMDAATQPGQAGGEAAAKRKPLVALARESITEYATIVKRVVTDTARVAVQRAAGLGGAAAAAGQQAGQQQQQHAQGSLDSVVEFKDDWGADTIAQVLSAVSTDLGLLASSLPELGLKDKARELVQACVRHHAGLCFHALKQHAVACACALRNVLGDGAAPSTTYAYAGGEHSGGPTLRKGYQRLTELLRSGLAAVLTGLKGYEQHVRLLAPWREEWSDVVQGGLQSTFLGLLGSFMELCQIRYDGSDLLREALKGSSAISLSASMNVSGGISSAAINQGNNTSGSSSSSANNASSGGDGEDGKGPKSGLMLLLAKACFFMEQNLVPWVMETIASAFAGGSSNRDAPPAFVPGEVARRLSAASSALVAAYVEAHGRTLSSTVRRSVAATNWLACKEPRAPRPVCDLFLERLARVEAEVGQLLDDALRPQTGDNGPAGGPSSSSRTGNSYADPAAALEAGNVARSVARLFRDTKAQGVFSNVGLSAPQILAAVCGVGLKSLVECIRLQTLGRAGLQQLQLDVAYLRPAVRRYTRGGAGGATRGAHVVEGLLDEVVAAGAERCLEPALLEPAVLERILSSLNN